MQPRWRKVLRNLKDNKVRTALVVLSIFIGVFAVGVTTAMYGLVGEDLNTSWANSHPAHAYLYVAPFDEEFLESVRRLPGVAAAEGRTGVGVRLRVGPEKWIPLNLSARPDWGGSRIDTLKPVQGKWPPENRELILERASLELSGARVGDEVEIELNDMTRRKLRLVGLVHDAQAGPGSELGLTGYVSLEMMEWLHDSMQLTNLSVVVEGSPTQESEVRAVTDVVSEHMRKSGMEVYYVYIPPVGQHPGYSSVLGVLGIIGALGFMSLFLAGFLITNSFSALMVQHVRYIGVMKAVGARNRQIIGMYLAMIVGYSVMALIPAIPLSAYVASVVVIAMGSQFNYESLGFRLVPSSVILQIAVGLGIPLLAGILPVRAGTRISVHDALSTYGLGRGRFGRGMMDRIVENIRGLSRPLLISIRNTFRRKGRLALTLITLGLGGAIFVAVFNLRESMVVFIDQINRYFLADVNVSLNQAYLWSEVEDCLMAVPGVERAEGWTAANGELLRLDGSPAESITILAPPLASELIEPVMLEGRWLAPGDQNAIVVSNAFWRAVPGLKAGDELRINISEKETTWTVVGFFKFPGDTNLIAYTSDEYLSALLGIPNRAFLVRIVGEDHSVAAQEALGKRIKEALDRRGFQSGDVQTSSMIVEANARVINIIMGFFLFFAVLVALVGAIGLMGTMSMNVLERTREIGVMRAIGATNRAIFRIVLVEGMLVGFISWALGALAAFPISQALYDILSRALFQTEGKAVITQDGFLTWLILAVILSGIASLLPARSASRMTVRDVLAYE
jgi:putative ABC transport system permease protein